MPDYIVVVRNPNAPNVPEPCTFHRRWAEVFGEIFFGTTLKPEVREVIERTGSAVEFYNRTQMAAVAAAVDTWTDDDEDWRSALP